MLTGFPLRLKKLETWKGIIVGGKSGNFEQTGKIRQNYTKYWKTKGISHKFYLLFVTYIKINYVSFAKRDQVFSLKNTGKMEEKILEKSGNFISPEKWEP